MFELSTSTVKVTLLAGGVVVGLLVFLLARRPRAPRADDLGPISEQWIADHKRGSDSLF